jgi:hypothetical protein
LPHRFLVKSALAICLTLASSGAVTILPRVAEAKPPAAKGAKQPIGVGAITGPQGPKVRAKVIKVLRDSGTYEVTDVEDIKPGSSPQSYQTMATGIQADAIMVGTVSKNMTLTLSVYAANGVRIDAVTIKGGGSAPKLLKAVDDQLEIAVADPLSRARQTGGKSAAAAAPVAAAPAAAAPAAPAPAAGPVAEEEEEDEAPKPDKKAAATAATAKAKGSGDEVESTDTPETPEEATAQESSSSNDSAASSDESEKGVRPVELTLGLRLYNRKFDYTGTQSGPLTPYDLALGPAIIFAGEVYPAAFKSNGVLSNIGLMGRYELGIATKTNYQAVTNGPVTTLQTHAHEFDIGVRARMPLGIAELGTFFEYGVQSFALIGDENPKGAAYAVVPDVHYHYLRTGLDLRFYISKLTVGGHVAPRFLTSMKELDKGGSSPTTSPLWFPGATGSGLDAGLMLSWQVIPWLAASGGVDFVRYGFNFNNLPAQPTPRVIAGGATDTYLSFWFGASTNFEFLTHGSAASASVSTTSPAASETSEEKPAKEEAVPAAAPPAKAKATKQPASKDGGGKKKKAAPAPEEEDEEE